MVRNADKTAKKFVIGPGGDAMDRYFNTEGLSALAVHYMVRLDDRPKR
ncbi:MAG: hypothetical protein HFH93_09615 [Lachnospiraceae bacterium]|nr:hypothetical protein [Lachnospiraceae bacterium]